jgi:hypothetical protein
MANPPEIAGRRLSVLPGLSSFMDHPARLRLETLPGLPSFPEIRSEVLSHKIDRFPSMTMLRKRLAMIGIVALLLMGSFSLFEQPAKAAPLDCSSSSMLAYGTIYDNKGNVLAQNVWFTAFNPIADYTYNVGNNTFNQPGNAMVWGNAGFPNAITGPQKYLDLSLNYVLNIQELYNSGQNVQSDLIKISTLDFTVPSTPTIPTPPQASSVTDTQSQVSITPFEELAIVCIALLIVVGVMAFMLIRKKNQK